jgi:hypothetical protein
MEDLVLYYLMSETDLKEVVDTDDFLRKLRTGDNSSE